MAASCLSCRQPALCTAHLAQTGLRVGSAWSSGRGLAGGLPAHELIRLHGRGVLGARAGLTRAVALGDGVDELRLVRVQRPVLACTRHSPTGARHNLHCRSVACPQPRPCGLHACMRCPRRGKLHSDHMTQPPWLVPACTREQPQLAVPEGPRKVHGANPVVPQCAARVQPAAQASRTCPRTSLHLAPHGLEGLLLGLLGLAQHLGQRLAGRHRAVLHAPAALGLHSLQLHAARPARSRVCPSALGCGLGRGQTAQTLRMVRQSSESQQQATFSPAPQALAGSLSCTVSV